MTSEKIKQLQEMGFSEAQASDALKASNNDLELAIAHLFGDPISEPPPPPNTSNLENKENSQLVPYSDTIQVSNPHDIPDFSLLTDNSSGTAEWTNFRQDNLTDPYGHAQTNSNSREFRVGLTNDDADDDEYEDKGYDDQDDDDYPASDELIDRKVSETVFEIPLSFAREEDISPAVLPKSTSTLKSCLMSLLVSLSQVTKFRQIYLSKDLNYGFDENWFNPNTELTVEVPEEFQDKPLYRFVVEVQRILGFLTAASKRAFITGENLFKSLPDDFANIDDEWEDVIKKFYLYLVTGAETILDQDLAPLFSMEVECNDEERTDLAILQMEFETRGTTLQEGFNSLFWNSELNPVFTKIGPLLTVQVFGDDEGYQTQQFEIPEYFYPGVYAKEYQSLVKQMDHKKFNIHKERSGITAKLLGYSSFEGKKIKKILQNSIDYFATTDEKEAHDDLSKLTEKIQNESITLNERLRTLSQEYSKMDITNTANILNTIESEGLPIPQKYILTAVIVSDSEYIYRARDLTTSSDDEWLYIIIDLTYDQVLNFRSDVMNFEAVQSFVLEETKLNNKQLILFYASEDSFEGTLKLPQKLAEFFDKDNRLLAQSMKEAKAKAIKEEEQEEDDDEREKEKEKDNGSCDMDVDSDTRHIELKGEDVVPTN